MDPLEMVLMGAQQQELSKKRRNRHVNCVLALDCTHISELGALNRPSKLFNRDSNVDFPSVDETAQSVDGTAEPEAVLTTGGAATPVVSQLKRRHRLLHLMASFSTSSSILSISTTRLAQLVWSTSLVT